MKILHVINRVSPTSIPIDWANRMAENNDVTIISLYDNRDKMRESLNVIAPKCKGYGLNFKKNPISAIIRSKKILRNQKYEIVHTHQIFSGALFRLLASKTKSGIVHTVHTSHKHLSKKQNYIAGTTMRLCNAIVFNSENTRNNFTSRLLKKVEKVQQFVIYNGVDIKSIKKTSTDDINRIQLLSSIPSNQILFCQIGRLEKIKNPMGTLQGFEKFLMELEENERIKYTLLFAGDGSERKQLNEYVESNELLRSSVIFLGLLPRQQVYGLIKRIDYIVVPSFSEGFCNALFEALSFGVQPIISDIPVFNEILKDDKDIIKFNPNSSTSISAAMKSAVDNKWGENEKIKWSKYVQENLDVQVSIDKYIKVYRDVLEQKS